MKHKFLIATCAFTLTGCLEQSQIQGKYVDQQDECRAAATPAFITPGGQSAVGAQFSECMNKAGWHVSTPKTGGATPGPVASNPPTGSPSTAPSAATAVAPPAQTAAAANPPSGAPSVKPSAAAARVNPAPAPVTQPATAEPGIATYQPARPTATQAVPYGQGAGRQF